MSTTTFAGPVKAGDILNTTGTTLNVDIANVGFATMGQTYILHQGSADPYWTDIVIPANSQIIRMVVIVRVVSDTHPVYVGRNDSVGAADDWFVDSLATSAVGMKEVVGADVKLASRWENVGAIDCHLTYKWDSAGSDPGRASLLVEYIQGNNLT